MGISIMTLTSGLDLLLEYWPITGAIGTNFDNG